MPWWATVLGRRQSYVVLAGGHEVDGYWRDVFCWGVVLPAAFGNPKKMVFLSIPSKGVTLHLTTNRS